MKKHFSNIAVLLLVAFTMLALSAVSVSAQELSAQYLHLDYNAEKVIADGQIVYTLDNETGTIARLDTRSGDMQVARINNPTSMAFEGTVIVVTSLPNGESFDHYRLFRDGTQRGYLTVLDATTMEIVRIINLTIDPLDVALSGTFAVVSPGSGQWTPTLSVNITTGEIVGQTGILFDGNRITSTPSENVVFGADTRLSPADIYRIEVDPETGALTADDSPYHGDYDVAPMGGNVFISGDLLITPNGGVFSQTDLSAISIVNGIDGTIEAVAYFDSHIYAAYRTDNGLITIQRVAVNANMVVIAYTTVAVIPAEHARALELNGDKLIVVFVTGDHTYVETITLDN